jgi:hypothetical protein
VQRESLFPTRHLTVHIDLGQKLILHTEIRPSHGQLGSHQATHSSGDHAGVVGRRRVYDPVRCTLHADRNQDEMVSSGFVVIIVPN